MASKVHRVRYYNPKPESINCVSYNKERKHIALARADASIEIWDLSYAPYLLKFIPVVVDGSVEAIGWVGERLLTTGLGGALIEWDLKTLNVKSTVLLTGYAAWCLAVNPAKTLVAVGTEQGYINIFAVEDDDIVHKKLFDKQEGRIMCCVFDKTGNTLITGSIDTIRVWNIETGHATCRILASRRGKETIVWSLVALSDNVIVSGDSHGRLTFWDSVLGEQIESYTTHKADILTITVSDDETDLYCSGVDPVIAHFKKVYQNNDKQKKESAGQWVKHVQRNIHEHDVRALVINNERLLSVGADGYLTLSKYAPKWVMRIPHMIPNPRTFVSVKKKLLLLRYSNYLEVWKLGSYATNNGNLVFNNETLAKPHRKHSLIADINDVSNETMNNLVISEKPVKLASIESKKKKLILCCEMAPSGEFIVYSTENTIRMLKLEIDEEQSSLSLSKLPVGKEGSSDVGCTHIAFTADSRMMVTHSAETLQFYHVDPTAGAVPNYSMRIDKFLTGSSLLHLLISDKCAGGAEYLVTGHSGGGVDIWVRGRKKFEIYAYVPTHRCVPCGLTIDYARNLLVIVYVDKKVLEFDLLRKKVQLLVCPSAVPGWSAPAACPHPQRPAIVLHDESALYVWSRDQNEDVEWFRDRKYPRSDANPGSYGNSNTIPIKYSAGFHWIGPDEAVSVEIRPETIISQLPPVFNPKSIYRKHSK